MKLAIFSMVFLLLSMQEIYTPDFCASMQIEKAGIYYDGGNALFPASLHLAFPRIYIDEDGNAESLPKSSVEGNISFLQVDGASYRQVTLKIKFRPYLYDHLIPYLPHYWEGWGGERIPYVGEWQLSYEEENTSGWEKKEITGAINPACMKGVPDELLADADFNGSPAAFWNYEVFSR
ncbi:MAG: hypothetical protein B6I38_03540 [Anaerolineaceae bacterium 4572_5.1]|nr:MAG: hypothetical protein B5M51_02745 [Anaerolinea sp. 4484_236]OQY33501.1 MAG: hypothetical protein B6I38_03540 [Anaerolineaceae bacterium 4572_5.1]